MADKIQLTIESFVPELDALVHKGVFMKKDAKKIIKKRRYHEYQFEKKDVSTIDFFKAIRYEKILHKRFKSKKKELKIKQTDYYDFHFIRRIIVLFKKCLLKFSHDEKIWLEFFNFLIKNNSLKILNREIGNCLVKHPNNITFWKIAAYNELENNFNSITARQLMQKCIRLNGNNINAYVEYFVFEIVFANKYLERKKIMSGNGEENKDGLKIINEIKEKDNDEDIEMTKEKEPVDDTNDIINLKVPLFIWQETLSKVNQFKGMTKTDINLLMLNKLEKYAQKTNYASLEEKVIQEIIKDNKNNLPIHIAIINSKLEKYSSNESDYIKHMLTESLMLYNDSNRNQWNTICYHLLKHVSQKDNKSSILPSLFSGICPKVNIEDIRYQYDINDNLSLFHLLCNSNIIVESSKLFMGKQTTMNDVAYEIFAKIIQTHQENYLEEIFSIISDLSFEGFEYEKVFNISIKAQSNSFILKYIKHAMIVISLGITFDPELQKTLEYFEMLHEQLMKSRLDNDCTKSLYERMLRVILDKMREANEITDDHLKGIEYIKEKMSKKMISFNRIKNEITLNFTKEHKALLENL